MTALMTYLVGDCGSGYALERIPGQYGNSRREWWLCWDDTERKPTMVADRNLDSTPVLSEDRPPFGEYQVADVYDGTTLVRWDNSTSYVSLAFREVTVDGVTWNVLLDGTGYPWVIKPKRDADVVATVCATCLAPVYREYDDDPDSEWTHGTDADNDHTPMPSRSA